MEPIFFRMEEERRLRDRIYKSTKSSENELLTKKEKPTTVSFTLIVILYTVIRREEVRKTVYEEKTQRNIILLQRSRIVGDVVLKYLNTHLRSVTPWRV
jgi:hypothetical protein